MTERPLQEAAREFGLNPSTLHRYIKLGRLKRYRRMGDKRTFVDAEELRQLLSLREEPLRGR